MGKSKKSGLVTQGKKKKIAVDAVLSSTESEGEDSGSGSGRPGGKGGRNGTIRHVYTTNSDMECIEEYLKPVYKDGEVILEVECGSNKAMMYLSKLCQGSKGPCVQFQGSWLTPNEFQYVSGRETAKDWKRSIRHQGKSMKLLLTKGVLSVHSTVCDCDGCRLTSPVNRCRLAEKRRSVYSTNRKERLTLESFTSCETSLSGTPDIHNTTEEQNEATDTDTPKEDPQTKKASAKNCSPLRESRLSNIIDQLRTSKERETSSDVHGCKNEFCEDENRTRDENGNEGDDDTDVEHGGSSEEEGVEPEPGTEAGPKPVPHTQTSIQDMETENLLSVTPTEKSATSCKDLDAEKDDKPASEDSETSKAEETSIDVTQTLECIPEDTVKLCKKNDDKCLDTKVETVKLVDEKSEPFESSKTQTKQILTEKIQDDQLKPALSKHISDLPAPTVETIPVNSKDITKDSSSDHHSGMPAATVSMRAEKKVSAESNAGVKKLSEHKPPKVPASCASRKDKREDKEAKSRSILGKKLTPAAPTQDYPASVSCPTALPASVPEQFFSGDVPGAKYSDFIRLLAASHLGGHIPLAPDRLVGDNLQAYPLASNFSGLPHPFPAYPFFPHQLPMKDTPPFQLPPMSIPPPFLPPYMYRPFGLLPHTFLDPAKYAHLNSVPEAFRPSPNDSAADAPRKRHSDSDSALDLSTKRFKFDDRLVSPPGSGYQLPRKPSSQTSACHKDKKLYANRQGRDSPSSSSTPVKAMELADSYLKTDKTSEKSSSRRECSCLGSRKDDIRLWSVTEVCQFLKTLDGCSVYADTFREHRVDGKSLPLLTVEHLMQNIGMKLGPAVLLTKTVAKRLKVSRHAHRKCQKCESKPSGLKTPITCNIGMGRVF